MRERRRQRFIDRDVQGALVKRIGLHWLGLVAIIFCALPLWRLASSGLDKPFAQLIIEGWKDALPVFVIMLAALPVLMWDTVKLSHRFVGPVYRLRSGLRSVLRDEPVRPIKLRKDDFWHDLAFDFNMAVERLGGRAGVEAEQEPPAKTEQPAEEEREVSSTAG